MYGWPMWLWWTMAGLGGALGLGMVARALWWDRSRGKLRCPKCWYEVTGLGRGADGWRCPECGRVTARERRLRKTRRRWRAAAIGLVLMLGLPALMITAYLRQPDKGWWDLTPTPVLLWIVGMQEKPIVGKPGQPVNIVQSELVNRLAGWYRPGLVHDWMVRYSASLTSAEHSSTQREIGLAALGALAARGEGLEALLHLATHDRSSAIRSSAVSCIGRAHPPVEYIMPLARAVFERKHEWYNVCRGLSRLLADYKGMLPASDVAELRTHLLALALEDDEDGGAAAVHALGEFQPMPADLIERLTALFETTQLGHMRWYALQHALTKCGRDAPRFASILVDRFNTHTHGSMGISVMNLGRLGKPAADAAPLLDSLANDPTMPHAVEARAARMAVLGLAPSFGQAFVQLLDSPDPEVRVAALYGLMRAEREVFVSMRPRIESFLSDPDPKMRKQALTAMLNLWADAAPSLPAIRRCRNDPTADPWGVSYVTREVERAKYMRDRDHNRVP